VGIAVEQPGGRIVWPQQGPTSCPAEFITQLAPHSSLTVLGTWTEQQGSGILSSAPSGRYVLVVDGRFRFSITVR
jgi:hypothetical protein